MPIPKCRWLRYSLGTMLVIVLALSVWLLAVTAMQRRETDKMNPLSAAAIAVMNEPAVIEALEQVEPTIVQSGSPKLEAEAGGRFSTHFVLVNPLDVPVTYQGLYISPSSPPPPVGETYPLYVMQIRKRDESQWQHDNAFVCIFGSGPMVINPGRADRFRAFLPLSESDCKIGIACSWTEDGIAHWNTIWSAKIVAR